jgi:iron complex outermembrane receptor protein
MDESGVPIHGSHIHTYYYNTITNTEGIFKIELLPRAEIQIYISNIGFQSLDTIIDLHQNKYVEFRLKTEKNSLDEIVIQHHVNGKPSVARQIVSEAYIKNEFSGSLSKTLENLPGINATEIGAATSKPIIRGLGFNRVVIAENGIKHEGQQWGADHGLEIDAFSAEEIEIIKSNGMIEYGSDAIGGIINIRNDLIPEKNSFSGNYTLLGRSVNQTLTNAISIQSRKDKFFYKFKATVSDYGDYNVPTDNIVYLSVNMPVYNNRLKNTAGNERNFLGQIGYVSDSYHSILTASNTYSKFGFFPGSHGIPSISRVEDDGDRRNIDFPYQSVNHFKLTNTHRWLFERSDLLLSVNVQNNRRKELSEFHTHFSNQEPPEQNPDVELDFNLTTLDSQLKYAHHFSVNTKINFGIQSQYQNNKIDGYGFLLPAYTRNTLGMFASFEHKTSEKLILNFGVRYDFANLKTERFFDPILYEYLINRGDGEAQASSFALRSSENNRNFQNVNAMGGLSYHPNPNWEYHFTLGTNFRIPTAIELASNGIHHGSFRHEQGDPSLSPERGIVTDIKAGYRKDNFNMGISPFLFYFQNYIFLSPSMTFSPLPHGGQIYKYTESEALITGVEFQVENTFYEKLKGLFVFEYIYNQQLTGSRSKNFPLPFSPPTNGYFEVAYDFGKLSDYFQETSFTVNTKFTLEQNRTAQNEQKTPGYNIYGFGFKTSLNIHSFKAVVTLSGNNMFNTRYFNHTNFYRALEIPEMGRNIQLMINIPFGA